ncbi:MAG TPA: hypothetical protein DCM40_01410, partial [Maribacter sp.]|nr:hypothetical protein [Maribacter sp.]
GIQSKEKVLTFNWNVYKVFKNGKRAKAPIHTFEATEEDHISYFEQEVKKNFSESFKGNKFELLRADKSQARPAEAINEEEEKFLKEKNRVLGRIIKNKNITHSKRMATALIYYAESGWRWQWAAIEAGTGKYVAGLSPQFKTTGEANEWIQTLVSTSV